VKTVKDQQSLYEVRAINNCIFVIFVPWQV